MLRPRYYQSLAILATVLISHECEPKDYLLTADCYRGSGRDMNGIFQTRPDHNKFKNAYRNKRKKKNALLNLKFHSRNHIFGSVSSRSSSLVSQLHDIQSI
uniref:Putative secreted protein n=1 Tax=Ixodes ricinus TaxID=34613 RepID=A0A6B0UG67_IXORI